MKKKICIGETYKDKEGKEKTAWNAVGELFESNGKEYVKLYMIPGKLLCVFEEKKKEVPF